MKESYRLPTVNGNRSTYDVQHYIKEWRELGDKITDMIGYPMTSFDPGLTFLIAGGHAFDMSVEIAENIIKYKIEESNER